MGTPDSVAEVVTMTRQGLRPEFLFFWGHQAGPRGGVGPWVFSQWWPAPFVVDGDEYPTAEHYMMTAKDLLFNDEVAAAAIRAATTPRAAKNAGQQVTGFDEARWGRAAIRHRRGG